ncbi:permease prefix domain 1-containing protein [Microbacterium sp. P5_E9]
MNSDIHRLLDEAFAGIEMTPDAQDLKEEVRANLVARADELEAAGLSAADAARQAIAELGDVRELLEGSIAPAQKESYAMVQQRHHVRPKPGFVVGVVVASVVTVASLIVVALAATGVLTLPVAGTIAILVLGAAGAGWIVGSSLSQETTSDHPMPSRRAAGFALATSLVVVGLGLTGLILTGILAMWVVVLAAVAGVLGIVLVSFLGATQTNRHKAWVVAAQRDAQMPPNRFEEEPETAARFGIYTAVIWILTFALMIALVFTVGWWWALLAFVGGFAVMMLVLARMMFGAKKS